MIKRGEAPGAEAVEENGWLAAHKYLILRRCSQLGILSLFLMGPTFGLWIVKGNLASSLTLDTLPLTDPFVTVQTLVTGYLPEFSALLGAIFVLTFYFIVGGRAYCSWVCPINIVTDTAEWLRRKLKIRGGIQVARNTHYWMLGAVLLATAATGMLAWELVNPISLIYRGLIFGLGLGWGVIVAIFVLDLIVGHRLWCGHLCPVGSFYGLLGQRSLTRVSASQREACNDCMDCFAVCPEPQVIKPALKGADKGIGPLIDSGRCTNCGRCIDVCAPNVFTYTNRITFHPSLHTNNHQKEVSP